MSRVRIIDALFIARRHTDAYVTLLSIDTGWLMGVPFGRQKVSRYLLEMTEVFSVKPSSGSEV